MKATIPIHFKEANNTLYSTTDDSDVKSLPVFKDGEHIVSCWRIPFWKRFKVLFTGKVWLVVRGNSHPPLWIDTECFD